MWTWPQVNRTWPQVNLAPGEPDPRWIWTEVNLSQGKVILTTGEPHPRWPWWQVSWTKMNLKLLNLNKGYTDYRWALIQVISLQVKLGQVNLTPRWTWLMVNLTSGEPQPRWTCRQVTLTTGEPELRWTCIQEKLYLGKEWTMVNLNQRAPEPWWTWRKVNREPDPKWTPIPSEFDPLVTLTWGRGMGGSLLRAFRAERSHPSSSAD